MAYCEQNQFGRNKNVQLFFFVSLSIFKLIKSNASN